MKYENRIIGLNYSANSKIIEWQIIQYCDSVHVARFKVKERLKMTKREAVYIADKFISEHNVDRDRHTLFFSKEISNLISDRNDLEDGDKFIYHGFRIEVGKAIKSI